MKPIDEALDKAITKIANIKGLCELCSELKKEALQAPTPGETLQIIKDYDGFQCNAVQYMRRIAWGTDEEYR